jgi:preprotein translocase subunit Sec61beta
MSDHKGRLTRFYLQYNPEKVSAVDDTLKKFAGREDEMFAALVQKYGPEPSSVATAGFKTRLVRFYEKYNPEKLTIVDDTLKKFAGREGEMFAALVQKYGPEPTEAAGGDDQRARLHRFYQRYNPEKLNMVDETLKKFAGREEEMFTALVQKYGPEPSESEEPRQPTTIEAAAISGYKARLVRFYEQYNPEKLAGVDVTLQKFAGHEEEMFAALVAKYGAEPDVNPRPPSNTSSGGPTSLAADYHGRLTRYYATYNPEKLPTVEGTLQKFAGREEEMFAVLVQKYGPEPPITSAPVAAPQESERADYKQRLQRYYQHYNPDKLADVDATVAKYAGREEDMFAALVQKYGPEPPLQQPPTAGAAASPYRDRLARFYQQYNPEKLSTVDATLAKFGGREEEMFQALVQKYGAEPRGIPHSAATPGDLLYRTRLARFYERYNPEKVGMVDATLEKFAGREEEMFAALVHKYGPEPRSRAGSTAEAPGFQNDHRARLVRFYQQYQPDRLANVDATLAKFAGREDEMFAALVQKYGSEPVQQPSGADHFKSRLTRMYETYNPERLSTVEATLTKFAGREEEMFAALVQKYGPEPPARASSTHGDTVPVSQPVDFRPRLVRFYQQYLPDNLATVDAVLNKFAGREEEMFAALIQKYGPEPRSVIGNATFAARLTAFYQKYNPDKVSTVEATLAKFAGREEEMFAALVQKYGPEPADATQATTDGAAHEDYYRTRLTRFYQHYQPERVANVEATLAKFAGREEEMFTALVQKYGPEPPLRPKRRSSNVARLTRFYEAYNPEKLSSVEATLTKFEGREEEMFAALVQKYGPEPAVSTANSSTAASSTAISPAVKPAKPAAPLPQQLVEKAPLTGPSSRNPTPPPSHKHATALPVTDAAALPEKTSSTPPPQLTVPAPPLQRSAMSPTGRRSLQRTASNTADLLTVEHNARCLLEAEETDDRAMTIAEMSHRAHRLRLLHECESMMATTSRQKLHVYWHAWLGHVAAKRQMSRLLLAQDLTFYQRLTFAKNLNKYCDTLDTEGKRKDASAQRRARKEQESPRGADEAGLLLSGGYSPGLAAAQRGSVRNLRGAFEQSAPGSPLKRVSSNKLSSPSASFSASGSFSQRRQPGGAAAASDPSSPLGLKRVHSDMSAQRAAAVRKEGDASAPVSPRRTMSLAQLGSKHTSRRVVDAAATDAAGKLSEDEKTKLMRRMSKWNLPVPSALQAQQQQHTQGQEPRATTPRTHTAVKPSQSSSSFHLSSSGDKRDLSSSFTISRADSSPRGYQLAGRGAPAAARAAGTGKVTKEEAEKLYLEAVLEAEFIKADTKSKSATPR